jgi:mRNA-degrading endonuclease RelE of RelBE toxin-antitoxin system
MAAACEIQRTSSFVNTLKYLAKKHRGLEEDVDAELQSLAASDQPQGQRIPGCGSHPCYKVRLAGMGKGKSGAFRLIYYRAERLVVALFIYGKGDLDNVQPKEIRDALKGLELPTKDD